MSQPDYNFTYLGTSTGGVAVRTGPTYLHTVTINTASTAASPTFTLHNATSSSTGQFALVSQGTAGTLLFDATLLAGLFISQTSSTGDVTVTWA